MELGTSKVDNWKTSIPGKGNSKYKGLGSRTGLRMSKEATVQWERRRERSE